MPNNHNSNSTADGSSSTTTKTTLTRKPKSSKKRPRKMLTSKHYHKEPKKNSKIQHYSQKNTNLNHRNRPKGTQNDATSPSQPLNISQFLQNDNMVQSFASGEDHIYHTTTTTTMASQQYQFQYFSFNMARNSYGLGDADRRKMAMWVQLLDLKRVLGSVSSSGNHAMGRESYHMEEANGIERQRQQRDSVSVYQQQQRKERSSRFKQPQQHHTTSSPVTEPNTPSSATRDHHFIMSPRSPRRASAIASSSSSSRQDQQQQQKHASSSASSNNNSATTKSKLPPPPHLVIPDKLSNYKTTSYDDDEEDLNLLSPSTATGAHGGTNFSPSVTSPNGAATGSLSARSIPSYRSHDSINHHHHQQQHWYPSNTPNTPVVQRQQFHLLLCADATKQEQQKCKNYLEKQELATTTKRNHPSSTLEFWNSTADELDTIQPQTGGAILHILNHGSAEDSSLHFSRLGGANGIPQTHASPFVLHNEKPLGYICGSYYETYRETQLTPMYSFNFHTQLWSVQNRQNFINRALDNSRKLIDRRYGHSMVYHCNNIYVFGGFRSRKQYQSAKDRLGGSNWLQSSLGGLTNEVVRFDCKRQTWNQVHVFQSWRDAHSSSTDNSRHNNKADVVTTPSMKKRDKYEYSSARSSSASSTTESYYSQQTLEMDSGGACPRYDAFVKSNMIPSPRMQHTTTLFGSTVIMFGGLLENDECSNDLYSFDLKKRRWKRLGEHIYRGGEWAEADTMDSDNDDSASEQESPLPSSPPQSGEKPLKHRHIPKPRKLHAACRHGDCLFVYGGLDQENQLLRDLYFFSLTLNQWTRIEYSVATLDHTPGGRFSHFAFILPPMAEVVGSTDEAPIIQTNEDPILVMGGGHTDGGAGDQELFQDGYMLKLPSRLFSQEKESLYMPMLDEFSDVVCVVHGEIFHLHSCILSQSRVLARHYKTEAARVAEGKKRAILDFSSLDLELIPAPTFYLLSVLMYGGYVSDLCYAEVKSLVECATILELESISHALQDIATHWEYDHSHIGMYFSGKEHCLVPHLESLRVDCMRNAGGEVPAGMLALRSAAEQEFSLPVHKYLLCVKFEYFCTLVKSRGASLRDIPLAYSTRTVSLLHAYLYTSIGDWFDLLPLREYTQLFELLEATHDLMAEDLHAIVTHRLCLSFSLDSFRSIMDMCKEKQEKLMFEEYIVKQSREYLESLDSKEKMGLMMMD